MSDILAIGNTPTSDNRITKIEVHTYNPYANTTLGNSDEIRIPIHQQDLYTLPCESFLYIEGKVILAEAPPENIDNDVTLDTNCAAFMFDEVRYELNGVEIDRCRNPGITTSLKTHASISPGKSKALATAGWYRKLDGKDFNFCIPFNMLFGFGEDYNKITVNVRQELVLIRSRNDLNALNGSNTLRPKIELFKVQWRMPHICLEEVTKLSLLRILERGQMIPMSFRSWDLFGIQIPANCNFATVVYTIRRRESATRDNDENYESIAKLDNNSSFVSPRKITLD